MIPSSLPSLDQVQWLPVNILAQIILDLVHLTADADRPDASSSIRVLHTVNPETCSWSELLPAITRYLGDTVKVVSFPTWLEALRETQDSSDPNLNPAVKLLDFYEQAERMGKAGLELPILETSTTQSQSRTLRDVGRVNGAWMEMWMKQWSF